MSKKTIYDVETSEQEFNFNNILNPLGVFNQLMRECIIREEQERQAKLIEARKKYVYGFKEVEFDKLFGKNVFDLDHTHVPGGMFQGIGFCDVGNLLHCLQTERTARGCQQDFLYGVLVFAD